MTRDSDSAAQRGNAAGPDARIGTGNTGAGRPRARRDTTDRQWRDLVGNGRSALSAGAAARVRETTPLTDAELSAAADSLVVQRRNWKPPTH